MNLKRVIIWLFRGKDSIVIYDLAIRAGVKYDAHYSQTTVDPPEIQKFIKNYPHPCYLGKTERINVSSYCQKKEKNVAHPYDPVLLFCFEGNRGKR